MIYSKTLDNRRLPIVDDENRMRRPRMGAPSSCLKLLVMIQNFIFMVGGLSLLGAGAYALMAPHYLLSMLGSHLLRVFAILFIVTGSLVLLFSFLGCCGAKLESKCLLGLYLLLIFLVCVSLIVCLIVLMTRQEEVKETGAQLIKNGLIQHYGFNRTLTNLVDTMQGDLRCCGVWTDRASVYLETRWFNSQPPDGNELRLPSSCCTRRIVDGRMKIIDKKRCQTLGVDKTKNRYFYTKGCMDALWDLWTSYRGYIVGSGAVVLVILVLLFATTFVFMCQIRHDSSSGGIHV